MNLNFSKRILENYIHPKFGYFESCSAYAVYSEAQILGTFLIGEKTGFIDYGQTSLRIDVSHYIFKSDKYELVDRASELTVGEYKIPVDLSGSMKPGTLVLEGKEYACKKLKPDVHYSSFKKSTWGHFKVKVFDTEEEAVYKLKVNVPVINLPTTRQRPFDGVIHTNTSNLRLPFCGLFLLEQVFEIRDNEIA